MEQIYTPKQDYKVLVRCFTYNQAKYIEDALNGFAMQKTDFPFVCLVMDDCSTDDEQDVIKAWMERECDMSKAQYYEIELSNIILVPHKTNESCTFAFYFLKQNLYGAGKKMPLVVPWREHCKYEAMCEGDDYWISSDKLLKQANLLENNPSVSLVCHRYKIYDQEQNIWSEDSSNSLFLSNEIEYSFSFEQMFEIEKWLTKTLTVMYRISCAKELYQYQGRSRDIINIYFIMKHGQGVIFREEMGVYRSSSSGVCAKQKLKLRVHDNYIVLRDLYNYDRSSIPRKMYYDTYSSLLFLSKGSLLFEDFDLCAIVISPYYLLKKIMRKIKLLIQ